MTDRCSICKSHSHGTQAHEAADRVSEKRERPPSTSEGATPTESVAGNSFTVDANGKSPYHISTVRVPSEPPTACACASLNGRGICNGCANMLRQQVQRGRDMVAEMASEPPAGAGAPIHEELWQVIKRLYERYHHGSFTNWPTIAERLTIWLATHATPVSTAPTGALSEDILATFCSLLDEEDNGAEHTAEQMTERVMLAIRPHLGTCCSLVAPVSTEEGRLREALEHAKELSGWLSTALTYMNRNVYDGAIKAMKSYHQWKDALSPAVAETQEGKA